MAEIQTDAQTSDLSNMLNHITFVEAHQVIEEAGICSPEKARELAELIAKGVRTRFGVRVQLTFKDVG